MRRKVERGTRTGQGWKGGRRKGRERESFNS